MAPLFIVALDYETMVEAVRKFYKLPKEAQVEVDFIGDVDDDETPDAELV